MELTTAFQEVCDACGQYPSVKGGLPVDDPRAQTVIAHLETIAGWLKERFVEFNGTPITIGISKGAGAFPRVPWVCLLPPGQRMKDGVYVGICFGKSGNGAVVGCMESASSAKGLPVAHRAGPGKVPAIDVDGVVAGTGYNNSFVNPVEVFRDAIDPDALAQHIADSLNLAIHTLRASRTAGESYSSKVLDALAHEPAAPFSFPIDHEKGRNAAACLTALLCRRLEGSGDIPVVESRTTYRWANGVVNLRNAIRDPQSFWTNVILEYAERIHEKSGGKDFVYLMSLWNPSDSNIHTWAIPEEIVYDALSRLPIGQLAQKKAITIRPQVPAIQNDPTPSDLSPYYRQLNLIESELAQLRKANAADLIVRRRVPQSVPVGGSEGDTTDDTTINGGPTAIPDGYSIDEAMKGLFLTKPQFETILSRLGRKKAVILQGPPGVGKTFVASRLAFALMQARDKRRVKTIQFHPSYGYEDFVQGYRPAGTGLTRHDGVLIQFVELARKEPDLKWFLVIDEINRGNLAKIFGELLMLMEADKRGPEHAIPLTYSDRSDQPFYLPENLYIIGTMNTADRSLSMVDYALRRRFAFVNLDPEFDSPSFTAWMTERKASNELIARIRQRIGTLNDAIEKERDLGSGFRIGHSFFCPPSGELNDAWYREVIDGEITPLLEEYFDSRDRVSKLISDLLA